MFHFRNETVIMKVMLEETGENPVRARRRETRENSINST